MLSPIYDDGQVALYHGDCRDVLPKLRGGGVDAVVTDPPYGDTSIDWDEPVRGWLDLVDAPHVVWEKHNGSGLQADRFRRVDEFVVHWYRGRWEELRHVVPTTDDATAR